jgi:mannose-1-phosphate guanylyltransferase
MKKVSVFILAGGKGKRFWPISQKKRPKQFVPLINGKSMLQVTYKRALGLTCKENIYLLTAKQQKNSVKKQLPELKQKNLIIEPQARSTAAAIGLAAVVAERKNPAQVMIVIPADQYITNKKKFKKTINKACKTASSSDSLVTIGIKATSASTLYGYLKLGRRKKVGKNFVYEVENFIEKPSKGKASRFVKSNKYYYNSGMFIWKSSVYLKQLKKHAPNIYSKINRISALADNFYTNKNLNRINSIYSSIKPASVDYKIMQKSNNILCLKGNFKWCDLGNLNSLKVLAERKDNSNAVINADYLQKDSKNCLVFTDKKRLIASLGVQNLIIIQTQNATLIADKSQVYRVKEIFDALE